MADEIAVRPEEHTARNRARVVFLAVSCASTLAVLVWAREILLPFVLAVVTAYVLSPAVLWVERRGAARWVAVIAVYVVTLGALYGVVATIAPRLGREMRSLTREIPALTLRARAELPVLRRWISRATTGPEALAPGSTDDAHEATGGGGDLPANPTPPTASSRGPDLAARAAGPVEPAPLLTSAAPSPPIRVVRRDDGIYDVELGPGIDVQQVSTGHWRVDEAEPPDPRPFDSARFLEDAATKAIAYGQRNTLEVIRLGESVVRAVFRTVFLFLMTLMLAAYIMLTREKIVGFFRSLVRRNGRASYDALIARIDRGLSGVVRGQLVICLVNGVLSALGFWIFHLKYWPLMAVLAGIMSLVPIFGSILSSIPIVALALTQSFGTALEVLLWIIGIHQLEAHVLNPKIIGDVAKIHPVLVVFSLLVGEHFFGIAGALLAVPTMSATQSLFLHFRQTTFGDDAPPDSFVPPRR